MTDEQCPVCGYYCLGNGGVGCIDKPQLCKQVVQDSRDAEVAELKAQNARRLEGLCKCGLERDQLRKDVTLLRDELKYIDWCVSNRPVIRERIQAVLAATEPKP